MLGFEIDAHQFHDCPTPDVESDEYNHSQAVLKQWFSGNDIEDFRLEELQLRVSMDCLDFLVDVEEDADYFGAVREFKFGLLGDESGLEDFLRIAIRRVCYPLPTDGQFQLTCY